MDPQKSTEDSAKGMSSKYMNIYILQIGMWQMGLEISQGQTRMILTGECNPGSSPVLIFHHESFGVGWRSNRNSSLGTATCFLCSSHQMHRSCVSTTPGEGQPDPCWTHRASQCCKGAGGTGGGCDLEEGWCVDLL